MNVTRVQNQLFTSHIVDTLASLVPQILQTGIFDIQTVHSKNSN